MCFLKSHQTLDVMTHLFKAIQSLQHGLASFVLLKAYFYTCVSFNELHDMPDEYGDISQLLPKSTFMAMKKGLSATSTPGDGYRILNES